MSITNKLKQLIEAIINQDDDNARSLFHDYLKDKFHNVLPAKPLNEGPEDKHADAIGEFDYLISHVRDTAVIQDFTDRFEQLKETFADAYEADDDDVIYPTADAMGALVKELQRYITKSGIILSDYDTFDTSQRRPH